MNCLLQFILCVRVFFGIITFEWGFGDLNFWGKFYWRWVFLKTYYTFIFIPSYSAIFNSTLYLLNNFTFYHICFSLMFTCYPFLTNKDHSFPLLIINSYTLRYVCKLYITRFLSKVNSFHQWCLVH
jgi:hypothetical protein